MVEELLEYILKETRKDEFYDVLMSIFGAELPKDEYIGTSTAHNCDRNSYKHRKDFQVYTGVILFYNPDIKQWTTTTHVFNYSDEGVVEFTDLGSPEEWKDTFYFGAPYVGRLKDVWDTPKAKKWYKKLEAGKLR